MDWAIVISHIIMITVLFAILRYESNRYWKLKEMYEELYSASIIALELLRLEYADKLRERGAYEDRASDVQEK